MWLSHPLHEVRGADGAVTEQVHKLRALPSIFGHVWPQLPQQVHQVDLILEEGGRGGERGGGRREEGGVARGVGRGNREEEVESTSGDFYASPTKRGTHLSFQNQTQLQIWS